jgi:hypothetical protein
VQPTELSLPNRDACNKILSEVVNLIFRPDALKGQLRPEHYTCLFEVYARKADHSYEKLVEVPFRGTDAEMDLLKAAVQKKAGHVLGGSEEAVPNTACASSDGILVLVGASSDRIAKCFAVIALALLVAHATKP